MDEQTSVSCHLHLLHYEIPEPHRIFPASQTENCFNWGADEIPTVFQLIVPHALSRPDQYGLSC